MNEGLFNPNLELDQFSEGEVKPAAIAGKSILLCHTSGLIFSIINRCSHADEQLECGRMRGGWVSCLADGARFDLKTRDQINRQQPNRLKPLKRALLPV